MPRHFLHVHDTDVARDKEGCEFPDLEAARAAALAGARSLMCEQICNGFLNLDDQTQVAGEEGQTLLMIRYGDAVYLRHR
jgi:hypothetical protein